MRGMAKAAVTCYTFLMNSKKVNRTVLTSLILIYFLMLLVINAGNLPRFFILAVTVVFLFILIRRIVKMTKQNREVNEAEEPHTLTDTEIAELSQYKEMLNKGLITETDYEDHKNQIMNR